MSERRPRLLDLFCCAGGASVGYARAGFEVVGVDIEPRPNYPYEFRQADALEVDLEGFDAIHASPPCQAFTVVSGYQGVAGRHPDLVEPTRQRLLEAGVPFVIENVPGAPIRRDVVLCGEMFGLRVHRHRVFETHGFFVMQSPHSKHRLKGARTNCDTRENVARWITGHFADPAGAAAAMGVDWKMTRHELAQAIPPAYTTHIGEYLFTAVTGRSNA